MSIKKASFGQHTSCHTLDGGGEGERGMRKGATWEGGRQKGR
jgi:hypothetical protein